MTYLPVYDVHYARIAALVGSLAGIPIPTAAAATVLADSISADEHWCCFKALI
jgi:hypothetical protein